VLTSLDQLHLILKMSLTIYTKLPTLMGRSTVLSLPAQLVFPVWVHVTMHSASWVHSTMHCAIWVHTTMQCARWVHSTMQCASWVHTTMHCARWVHSNMQCASWVHATMHCASWVHSTMQCVSWVHSTMQYVSLRGNLLCYNCTLRLPDAYEIGHWQWLFEIMRFESMNSYVSVCLVSASSP